MSEDSIYTRRYPRGSYERSYIPLAQVEDKMLPWWAGVFFGAVCFLASFVLYNLPAWFTPFVKAEFHPGICVGLVVLGITLIYRANTRRVTDEIAERIWEGGRMRPSYWGT